MERRCPVPVLSFLTLIFVLLLGSLSSAQTKLYFEENKGQLNDKVLDVLVMRNFGIYYEKSAISFKLIDLHELIFNDHPKTMKKAIEDQSKFYSHSYRVEFLGANNKVQHKNSNPAGFYHNYFLGNDAKKWAGEVHSFEEQDYTNLYPGINLKVYSLEGQLKHDFIIRAGSNSNQLQMKYTGADSLFISDGNLMIATSLGWVTEKAPVAYQLINGIHSPVKCLYRIKGTTVSFDLPQGYNKQYDLIVDPILVGSTFSGSTMDNWGWTATYDNPGNMISGGIVTSALSGPTGYPVTAGAFQTNFAGGGVGGIYPWPWDVGIIKYNTNGSAILFATFLGGSENDYPHSMVVDANDNLYVYGKTYSTDFPVTSGAYSTSNHGGADLFITKFNAAGSALLGSTYVGGSLDDGVNYLAGEDVFGNLKFNYGDDARGEINIDLNDDIFVATCTQSSDFPVTAGAYCTAFKGTIQDACLFKLSADFSTLDWSTYLGGTSDDAAYALALDTAGNVYTAGGTLSSDFPVTAGTLHTSYLGSTDGFVCLVKKDGSALLASSYIGTGSYDQCYFVQTDKDNSVYLYGQTEGTYPLTPGVYNNTPGGMFIQKLNSGLGTSLMSTTIGDGINAYPNISPSAFLVDNCYNIYIAGWGGKLYPGYGFQGVTTGLPVSASAYQSTTDGAAFYLMSLTKNAGSLIYATFFSAPVNNLEHVDGGTSRFDKRGVIYQSVCGGCGGYSNFPTTPSAWSKTNNSPNCNNAIFKIDFQTPNVTAVASTSGGSGCAPFTFTFTNNSKNATSYSWNFGDGSPIDTSSSPTHQFNTGGTYTVKLVAKNPSSCNGADSSTVEVVIKPTPQVNLGQNIDLDCDSISTVTLDAANTGSHYLWNTGDTTQTIKPSATGTYWVKVSYTTGCSSIDSIELTGTPIPPRVKPLLIPNVFTPNGDNVNDTYVISIIGQLSEYNLEIFNRWGTEVFKSTSISDSWDGKINGDNASAGTYYYLLKFKSSCFKTTMTEKGFLTLLR